MRLSSINSTYDVADGVRKRIILLVECNVYLRSAWLRDKKAGGKRKNFR